MPDNEIYKFMKENNLTTKDEVTFLEEYSAPEKAQKLHDFFTENKLTEKDSATFYDTYLKKKRTNRSFCSRFKSWYASWGIRCPFYWK